MKLSLIYWQIMNIAQYFYVGYLIDVLEIKNSLFSNFSRNLIIFDNVMLYTTKFHEREF
jgi:hypothetical protein